MPKNAAFFVTVAALILSSSCALVGGSSHGLRLPAGGEGRGSLRVMRLQGGEGCIGAAGRNGIDIRTQLGGFIGSLPGVSCLVPLQARELVAANLQAVGSNIHAIGVRFGKILEKCYAESHFLRHRVARRLASYVRGMRVRLEDCTDSANCIFNMPPPRTHAKSQFQRFLLRVPCFSGSAFARAESVGCMRGGGDSAKVAAQLQGFLEAVTCAADSVIKGVPGVIDGINSAADSVIKGVPCVIDGIKQFPKFRQLGVFKPGGGAQHGQRRYGDLPSVVQARA